MQNLKLTSAATITEGKAADLIFTAFRKPIPRSHGLQANIWTIDDNKGVEVEFFALPEMNGRYNAYLTVNGKITATAIVDEFDK